MKRNGPNPSFGRDLLLREALLADAQIEATGEFYRAEDVLEWLGCLANGEAARRPPLSGKGHEPTGM
jgi:hypothetical protein